MKKMNGTCSLLTTEARAQIAETTAHGIGRTVTAKRKVVRIMWALLFSLASIGFGLHLSRLTIHYLNNPISTSVSYRSVEFEFPDVTICNLLPLSLHKLELKDPTYERFLNLSSKQGLHSEKELRELLNGTQNDKYSMIVHCHYNRMSCGPENFTEFADPQFRSCFTFSPQQEITSNAAEMGLNLILYAENRHGHPMPNVYSVPSNWEASGIRLVIHERGTHAHPELKGVNVQTGVHAQFALIMQRALMIDSGKPRCDGDSRVVSYCLPEIIGTTRAFKESAEDCYSAAIQRLANAQCNCFSPEYDVPSDFCKNSAISYDRDLCDVDSPCFIDLKKNLSVNYADLVVRKCLPTCNQTSYQKQVSTSDWPSHIAERRVLSMLREKYQQLQAEGYKTTLSELFELSEEVIEADDLIQNNLLRVTVYPETLSGDTIVEEQAYPLFSFISEVGGILGLWMGASILTFLEPLQFMLNVAINCCNRKFSKKDAENENADKDLELNLDVEVYDA